MELVSFENKSSERQTRLEIPKMHTCYPLTATLHTLAPPQAPRKASSLCALEDPICSCLLWYLPGQIYTALLRVY